MARFVIGCLLAVLPGAPGQTQPSDGPRGNSGAGRNDLLGGLIIGIASGLVPRDKVRQPPAEARAALEAAVRIAYVPPAGYTPGHRMAYAYPGGGNVQPSFARIRAKRNPRPVVLREVAERPVEVRGVRPEYYYMPPPR